MSRQRYAEVVAKFDALCEYAVRISVELAGHTPANQNLAYADPIFTKLVCHAVSLRKLAPDPVVSERQTELWDISSSSAIARSIVEAFDALAYIALNEVGSSERSFRILLWELHDQVRRTKMLGHIGSHDPKVTEVAANAARLESEVIAHPYFASLESNVQRKVTDHDAPAFHLSQRERCRLNEVDFDYYNAATMHLSQFVHTLPFAVHQLLHFRAGEPDTFILMSLPMQYASGFLAKSIRGMRTIFPGMTSNPSQETEAELELHASMLASSIKNAG